MIEELQAALEARTAAGLTRRRRTIEHAEGPRVVVDGRELVQFCSNDYLGLAQHPDIAAAFAEAARTLGSGSGASHLVSGHHRAHHELEEALAEWTGRERALLFSTGYMANLGIGSALAGRGATVFEDRLNHASLLDAALGGGARLKRYAHADAGALASLLTGHDGRALVMTDGVFSMDGDLAPLPALAETARAHDALLVVDDAHGLGVLGATGRGTLEHFGLGQDEVPVLMGTLGKAFGVFGAFVAGPAVIVETLLQFARTYIYTTALPPAVAVAALEALRIVRTDEGRRERLRRNVARFLGDSRSVGRSHDALHSSALPEESRRAAEEGRRAAEEGRRAAVQRAAAGSPIVPVVVGDSERAMRMSAEIEQRGFLVPAIRPPTVPEGTARLRVTLSSEHTDEQIDGLLSALRELGLT